MSSSKKNQKRHQIIDLADDEDDLAREIMQVERGDDDDEEGYDYDQMGVEGIP